MGQIEDRLHALRSQQQEAARRYAQAEAKLDSVVARKRELLDGLKDLGFENPEDARREAEHLSDEVESILAEIEEKVRGL